MCTIRKVCPKGNFPPMDAPVITVWLPEEQAKRGLLVTYKETVYEVLDVTEQLTWLDGGILKDVFGGTK